MRRISAAVLVLATIVALAACGGGSNKAATNTSASASTSSGSTASAGGGDKGAFCQQVVNSKAESIGDDPNGAKQALAIFASLKPPDEIKGQWDDYLQALNELASTSSDDQAKLGQIAVRHAQSLSAVSLFISQSCLNLNSSDLSDLSNSLSSLSSGN